MTLHAVDAPASTVAGGVLVMASSLKVSEKTDELTDASHSTTSCESAAISSEVLAGTKKISPFLKLTSVSKLLSSA